jgi:maltooligosyltrehalose trehalohydrolase
MSHVTLAPQRQSERPEIGATYLRDEQCAFRVWAPHARRVTLELLSGRRERIALVSDRNGCWAATLREIAPGTRYKFSLNGKGSLPDPASRSQPDGVHGPSEVISHEFQWSDAAWHGRAIDDYVLYELHIGAFTQAGTFDAAINELSRLRELGITAIEVMPVSQFPGSRNWGYDGVYPYAVHNSSRGRRWF